MINSKSELKSYLEQDTASNNFSRTLFSYLTNDIWKFLRALRYYEYVQNTKKSWAFCLVRFIAKVRFRIISKKLGFSIPINVCGPGLMLPHYGNIVINGRSKIGKNCRIHVGVNIGASHDTFSKAPVIGDNCYIAPGAKIFGGVKIGDFTQIGANAVVNKSFPEGYCVLVGVPAKSARKITDYDSKKSHP